MSRIGKMPIVIPDKVEIKISDGMVTVKGPKGELREAISPKIKIIQEENELRFERTANDKSTLALHGLARALVNNMVVGVTEGFKKTLQIEGVGFRAEKRNKSLVMNLGYSHSVIFRIPAGLQIEIPNPTTISVSGISKYLVGQVAAKIRSFRKPEPYKGKGIRYVGEVIRRKAGKAGAK